MQWALGAVFAALAAWALVVAPGAAYLGFTGRRAEIRHLAYRLVPVAVFYVGYSALVRWTQRPSVVVLALRNAHGIVGMERWAHLDWEPWVSRHLSLPGFDSFYDWGQLFVVVGFLCFLAVGEPDYFWRCARNSLGMIAAGGFLVYWLVPVAPPWLLGGYVHSAGLRNLQGVGELLGAMPSLHTAWAAWVAFMAWAVCPKWWYRAAVLNLVLTVWVVIATGNHYVFDVIAGEALAYGAVWLADRWERSPVRDRVLGARWPSLGIGQGVPA